MYQADKQRGRFEWFESGWEPRTGAADPRYDCPSTSQLNSGRSVGYSVPGENRGAPRRSAETDVGVVVIPLTCPCVLSRLTLSKRHCGSNLDHVIMCRYDESSLRPHAWNCRQRLEFL
jgi:hypothetical protein